MKLAVTVRLDDVVITHNTNAAGTEVVFHCNPLLSNVVDLGTVEIEVEWFVNDRRVEEESFLLRDKTVGTLGQTMWTVGQTVRRGLAKAKHSWYQLRSRMGPARLFDFSWETSVLANGLVASRQPLDISTCRGVIHKEKKLLKIFLKNLLKTFLRFLIH